MAGTSPAYRLILKNKDTGTYQEAGVLWAAEKIPNTFNMVFHTGEKAKKDGNINIFELDDAQRERFYMNIAPTKQKQQSPVDYNTGNDDIGF